MPYTPKETPMSTAFASPATEPVAASSPVQRLEDDTAREFVQVFKLLADETRVRILHYLLQQEEFNVRTLCELLQQSQPAVSHHLALLRMAGLIECRRDGKHNFYHLVPKRVQAVLNLLFGTSGTASRKIRFEDCTLTYQKDEQLGA
jgi:ArsR family transcriptional regulator